MVNLPGWRNLPSAKTLSVMIFLAGIGLIVSVISLIYLSQHLISIKTNEIDRHRSVLSVDGAVQTSVNRVLSLVLDNSIWDDAVKQTYAPVLNTGWLYDSWGSGFKINNLYDGTFVLDQHYRVLWGSFRSQAFNETDIRFLAAVCNRSSPGMLKHCAAAKAPTPVLPAPVKASPLLVSD
jgi:sensor domain CHASE-containing protein